MSIQYRTNLPVSTDQFIDLLRRSTLAERRPVDDRACMKGMISNSNLIVSAWENDQLIGIARSMTDYYYACYLSDLAVSKMHQKQGIGKQLQKRTREALGPQCKLILVAAPKANSYYRHLGFNHNEACWVLAADADFSA